MQKIYFYLKFLQIKRLLYFIWCLNFYIFDVMQQSFIYNLIKNSPYPFIVRHNRQQVYNQHPELDYAYLWRYSVRFSVFGYIVGKFLKRPWTFAIIAPVPLILKFLYDEYNMKKQGKYQQIYRFQNWQVKRKIDQIQQKQKQIQVVKQKNFQIQNKVTLKQNYSGQRIVSTHQYVKRLPKAYF